MSKSKKGVGALGLLLILVVILVIAGVGVLVYKRQHTTPKTNGTTSSATKKQTDPTAGWTTYTSSNEKATFKYPKGWTVSAPYISSSNRANTDQIGLVSPSGTIKISWVSDLNGVGNEATANYPLNTIIDKTTLPGASGLYVVSGITTTDGTTYHPWIAVQDGSGILADGVQGNVATFEARKSINPSTGSLTGILLSTSGVRTNQNTPSLSKDQATAWFAGSEAQQSKQILLTFADPS